MNAFEASTLLDDISSTIAGTIDCKEEQNTALTLWVAHTYFMDDVQYSPLLVLNSPVLSCGKSTAIKIISKMSKDSDIQSGVTPSSLKRMLDKAEGENTFFLDEADQYMFNQQSKKNFTQILNSGYDRESSMMSLSEGSGSGKYEPKKLNVWGAKCLAGIGILRKLDATSKSRSIAINMRRRIDDGRNWVEPNDIPLERFESIKEGLALFSEEYRNRLIHGAYDFGDIRYNLDDRARNNWRYLLQIASFAGDEWLQKARRAAVSLSSELQESDSENAVMTDLLRDCERILSEYCREEIPCSTLCDKLNGDEGMRWHSHNNGRVLQANQLGMMLGQFDIKSYLSRRAGDTRQTQRVYNCKDFADAFRRYLPKNEAHDECLNR